MKEEFEKLINLVQATREAQKKYFAIRTQHNLQTAKALEKRLDDFVKLHYKEPNKPEQTNLF